MIQNFKYLNVFSSKKNLEEIRVYIIVCLFLVAKFISWELIFWTPFKCKLSYFCFLANRNFNIFVENYYFHFIKKPEKINL